MADESKGASQTPATRPDAGVQEFKGGDIAVADGGVQLRTLEDYWRFAQFVAKSGLAPKNMEKPEQILVALQHGAELGYSPMQALSVGHVINGRFGLEGNAAKALVRTRSGLKPGTAFREWIEGQGDEMVGWCEAWPAGAAEPVRSTFSVVDARRAGLWFDREPKEWKEKQSPWWKYPRRMLLARARGFLLRDHFDEFMRGTRVAEEIRDMPGEPERDVTPPRSEATPLDPLLADEPQAAAEPAVEPAAEPVAEPEDVEDVEDVEDAEIVERPDPPAAAGPEEPESAHQSFCTMDPMHEGPCEEVPPPGDEDVPLPLG